MGSRLYKDTREVICHLKNFTENFLALFLQSESDRHSWKALELKLRTLTLLLPDIPFLITLKSEQNRRWDSTMSIY